MIYRDVFLIVFFLPCLISIVMSVLAARTEVEDRKFSYFLFGVISHWLGLALAADLAYRAWQSMPDPPSEAFSDAGAGGALFMGWIPASFFCAIIFFLAKLTKKSNSTHSSQSSASQ